MESLLSNKDEKTAVCEGHHSSSVLTAPSTIATASQLDVPNNDASMNFIRNVL